MAKMMVFIAEQINKYHDFSHIIVAFVTEIYPSL